MDLDGPRPRPFADLPDTVDFLHRFQNSLLAVYKKGQERMHRFMMVWQRRFIQKGFPSVHIMLKRSVRHADTVCLATSQGLVPFHIQEFIFK